MKEFDINYYSSLDGASSTHDFGKIADMISHESMLLHPTARSLQESFDRHQAIVMYDREELVGFVRFTPLLDSLLKDKIGLSQEFPDISEIGSAVLLNEPEYRGKGLYAPLRNKLLETVSDKAIGGDILILGTTKNIAVYKVLQNSKELGLDFYPCRHTEFPMIAPFTCVCTPDFGQGFQLSGECPQRVETNQLINLEQIADETYGKIPCVMYVSDKDLARKMDAELLQTFGDNMINAQTELVQRLKVNNHYD